MRILLAALCIVANSFAHAGLPVVGEMLPAVSIDDLGSIEMRGDELEFQPWSTSKLQGKTVYLQHLAARSSVSDLNKHVDDAVEAKGYTPEQVLSVAVVNKDDALWGTGAFVAGELKKNKRRYPESIIVADNGGVALGTWQLEEKSVAIMVLSGEGRVLFFKQGALSAEDVTEVLDILAGQVGS